MGCNNVEAVHKLGFILPEIKATTKLVVATAPGMKQNRYAKSKEPI